MFYSIGAQETSSEVIANALKEAGIKCSVSQASVSIEGLKFVNWLFSVEPLTPEFTVRKL